MKSKLLTLAFFFSYSFIFSQTETHTAPTLQVGLDGLDFSKGALDSELILQIISEKQNEIKLRVAQNILLQPLNECGATIYSFGDNILKAVIEEKDPLIRKRKILESTVNTLFTVGFTKYYLNRANKDKSEEFVKSLTAFNDLKILILGKAYKEDNIDSSPILTVKEKDYYNSKIQLLYYSIILDIASHVIRTNSSLTKLGILNVSYSKTFDFQSNYLNFYIEDLVRFEGENNNNFEARKNNLEIAFQGITTDIYNGMKKELDNLTQLIGATKFLLDENNLRVAVKTFEFKAIDGIDENIDYKAIINTLNLLANRNIDTQTSNEINKIFNYIDKIKHRDNLTIKEWSDIAYTFNNEFIPSIEKMGISSNETFVLITKFRESSKILLNKISENPELKNSLEFLVQEDNLTFFTNLFSRLYEFDKGSTYIEYFNLISEISKFLEQIPSFKNSEVKEKLSYFNTFVKDYVVVNEIEEGKDYIDFNVESFLNHLAEMKSNQPNRLSFMFNVGASSGYFIKNPYEIDPETSLNNFSFVGEKIGLKVKFIDRKFWMSRSPGETYNIRGRGRIKTGVPKEPIISNYFWMLYGSGLVYNIFNLATESEFNSPFVGTGIGIGFFNNLDLSISGAVPIISNQSFSNSFQYPLLSLNFDIRFNEYLQRLGEKRKASQTQKALAKAQK